MVKMLSLDDKTMYAVEAATTGCPSKAMRVLIVEDETLVGWSLANFLQRMQIHAVVAESAEQAFDAFVAAPFDLVITDRKLPKMNGDELAQAIKNVAPLVPIILISALEFPKELKNSTIIDHFVEKPFNLHEMANLVLSYFSPQQG